MVQTNKNYISYDSTNVQFIYTIIIVKIVRLKNWVGNCIAYRQQC